MLNLEQVRQFLYHEARLLDDRQWDEWLSCYSPQVIYWMPAWGDDDQLTRDPQKRFRLSTIPTGKGWRIAFTALKPSAWGQHAGAADHPYHQQRRTAGESDEGLEVRYSWVTGATAISTPMPFSAPPAAR